MPHTADSVVDVNYFNVCQMRPCGGGTRLAVCC